MDKYNDGLLMSFIWWANHTNSLKFYCDNFLPMLKNAESHLEIGPGHGMYLSYIASKYPAIKLEGWDISLQSIKKTESCLAKLNPNKEIQLVTMDLFDADK